MIFDELLNTIKKIQCEETRVVEADYMEVVVSEPVMEEVSAILCSYFGQPLKPAGKSPCLLAQSYSKPYGGIQRQQTLYVLKREKGAELALLWPWDNGQGTTVKIIR